MEEHQNTVYWTDISLALLSNTIERFHFSRNIPSILYPESCSDGNWRSHIREDICVTSVSSKDFLVTSLDEKFGFRSCSTISGTSCATSKKFSTKPTNPIEDHDRTAKLVLCPQRALHSQESETHSFLEESVRCDRMEDLLFAFS